MNPAPSGPKDHMSTPPKPETGQGTEKRDFHVPKCSASSVPMPETAPTSPEWPKQPEDMPNTIA